MAGSRKQETKKKKNTDSSFTGLQKNDVFTVRIDDLSADGSGIGHAQPDGFTVFIKDALPGDVVRAKLMKRKASYGFARLLSLESPSPDRVPARCPAARQCGGCQLQHLAYPAQLAYKEKLVLSNLERIGGIQPSSCEFLPIIGMDSPWYYRNKAQYPVGPGKDGRPVIGFYAGRTHDIIDLAKYSCLQQTAAGDGSDTTCPACTLQMPAGHQVLEVCREWMESFDIPPYDEKTGAGLLRHILVRSAHATGEIMVCLVVNGDSIPYQDELISKLRRIGGMTSICLNPNKSRNNVIMGSSTKCLWGQPFITDLIGPVRYRISALSFFQVNPVQTERLYETALSFADPGPQDTVWDLYCGIGTISLFLARRAGNVWGVEIIPQAVEDARINAELNGISNVRFLCGQAEDLAGSKTRTDYPGIPDPDIIVVDPPRKGCDAALLEFIASRSPSRIVYVSCNSATLARDLKILARKDYHPVKIRCCDMFPHTIHCEVVALLSRT